MATTLRPASDAAQPPAPTKAEVAARWAERCAEIEGSPIPPNVGAILSEAARRHGEKLAWSFFERDEHWTFAQVHDGAHRAANALLRAGVGRGDRVAMMVPNSGLYLTTWLGLALIGAAVVPVNGRYTPTEVAHVLRKARVSQFIVERGRDDLVDHLANIADGFPRDCIVWDEGGADSWAAQVAAEPTELVRDCKVSGDDVLNVQFTSGTTGFPKGCQLPHRYWTNVAVAWDGYVEIPTDRILVNQMLFYLDGQFLAIFALYRGATLYCCSKPSGAKFSSWIREYRINSVFYFDALYKTAASESDADNELDLIHIFGFRPSLHADLQRRYGAIARESFGMTEFAPSLMMPLDSEVMVGSGSCGLTAPFCETKLVDDHGALVARGDVGELVVRSPALMQGYFDDEQATLDTLTDGWLHTGDLFRQDDDGFYYIVGRKKDMVRRNAENIACSEVESVLRMWPQVKEVAVVAVPDEWVGEEVKAYVELQAHVDLSTFDPADLLAFAGEHLATFKVPRYVEVHPSLPMTESSRVEKKKLTEGVADLTRGCYDRISRDWIRR